MPSLKASEQGKLKIKQARNEKGWMIDDDRCLIEASKILEPDINWEAEDFRDNRIYAAGVNFSSWKRFREGKTRITTEVFKAYCQVLGLDWKEIVDRNLTTAKPPSPESQPAQQERPDFSTAREYNNRGVDYLNNEQLDEALGDFNRAIELQPNYPQAYYHRAIVYERKHDFPRARADYQKAMLGGLAAAYSNLARLSIVGDKDYGTAAELSLGGLKITEEPLERYALLKNLGWARLEQKRYGEAEASLREAIALASKKAPAYALLAQVLDARGELEGAIAEWENFLRYASRDDSDENAWISLAQQRLSTAIGQLIEVEGEVLLKRERWSDYRQAEVGTQLFFGDLLKPSPGTKVRVQYADGTIWQVPTGEISGTARGWPQQHPMIDKPSGKTLAPRREFNPLIPYIISPRRTFLLNARPILRWNAVPGATAYAVSIEDEGGEVLWDARVRETAIAYPGDPALQPGVDYILIVEADTGASSEEEDLPDRGFSLLDEREAVLVQQAREELASQDLTEEGMQLALAYLYATYNLRAEAIETLETLVEQGSQTTAVYLMLGKLYGILGDLSVVRRYQKAFELASATEDLEGQAVAAWGLGKSYDALGDREQATNWLTLARERCAALVRHYQKAFELTPEADDLEEQQLEEQAVAAWGFWKSYDALGDRERATNWLTLARERYAALGDTETVSSIGQ